MNPTPNSSPLTRWTNGVLIVLFAGLLALPTLDVFLHLDPSSPPTENRSLTALPRLPAGWLELQGYVTGLEAYFTDHFGCRKCLVMWHNKLRWTLFKDRQNTHEVLIGKEGWLYYMQGQMFDHYTGLLQFTPEQLHDWQVLLEKRRDWLARRGIAYEFVVTPGKQTIYPEYLPDWLAHGKVRPETKTDQFFAYMRAHSTVPVLDLRRVVREAKKTLPTFLITDSHWNRFGGLVAYQQLMQALARQRPDIGEPLPLSAFTLTNELRPGGDLAKMLGLTMVESNAYYLLPQPGLPAFTSELPPPEHPKAPKFTRNPTAKGRLLVFHDSFAMNWIELLAYHFQQVHYLWQYELNPAAIEKEKPDIVVSEMNECYFNIESPKELMTQDALN